MENRASNRMPGVSDHQPGDDRDDCHGQPPSASEGSVMKTMMLSALIVATGIGLLGGAHPGGAPGPHPRTPGPHPDKLGDQGPPPDKPMPVEAWGSTLPDWSEQPGRSRHGR